MSKAEYKANRLTVTINDNDVYPPHFHVQGIHGECSLELRKPEYLTKANHRCRPLDDYELQQLYDWLVSPSPSIMWNNYLELCFKWNDLNPDHPCSLGHFAPSYTSLKQRK